MANATTNTQRRQLGRKAEDFRIAWKEQAPEATFGGKSLTDLEADIAALAGSVEAFDTATSNRSAALRARDGKKEDLNRTLRSIMRGVQADPAHGEDSPLYRAMGYIPLSERSSGLTRRTTTDGGDTAGNEEAAV
jgi:hypothetical protein